MNRVFSLGGLAVAFAVTASMSGSAAATARDASPRRFQAPTAAPPVRLTQADVDASNAKVAMAYGALIDMWSKDFQRIGERFAPPRIARYRQAFLSDCGVMQTDNAEYCPNDNTIYYDDVFIAGLEKQASAALGTDGDMAGLGVIAHEMGHAVAMQLGYDAPSSYENESVADCLAGAFAEQSKRDGSLEKGDEQEAFFGMASAGDPTPQLTGNRRVDRFILARAAAMGHGTREQRMENFSAGLHGGAGACLDAFSGL